MVLLLLDKIQGDIIFRDQVIDGNTVKKRIGTIECNLKKHFKTNDKVIVCMERCPELLMVLYALFDLSITYIPIDMEMPSARIQYIIDSIDAAGAISSNQTDNLSISLSNTITIQKLLEDDNEAVVIEKEEISVSYEDVISYILFTSGSTGNPKGVMVKKSSLLNLIDGINQRIDYRRGKKILCLTTVGFDIFFLESLMAMYDGLSIVLADSMQQKNPREIANLIVKHQVDMLQATPSRIQLLHSMDPTLDYLKNVQDIMIGGEEFPQNLLTILQNNVNAHIYNMYGPTETTVWSTISDLTNRDTCVLGEPIKDTRIYIMNEKLEKLPCGEKGEICIAGAGVASGYYHMPEHTNERFVMLDGERVYRTGDYGYYDKNDDLIYLGRKDNQVKIRGYRIELEEIDRTIIKLPYVSKAACIVCQEDKKSLIGFYQSDTQIEQTKIKEDLSSLLPEYMIPEVLYSIEEFPCNVNGKIDRKALEKISLTLSSTEGEKSEMPLDEIEERVFEILKTVVKHSNLDNGFMDLNLSQLGLNSVHYISVIVAIEDEFDMEFCEDALTLSYFKNLRELIAYVKENQE